MERVDIKPLEEERPNLFMELQWRKVTELYRLNDTPTGPDSERQGKKVWILYAVGQNNNYIIQSTKGNPDKFYTWLAYVDLPGQQGAGYIVIDKSKVGRKKRELTEQERAEILARHEKGEGIAKIAKAMHLGHRRIMGVINGE